MRALGRDEIVRMLLAGAEAIRAAQARLSALDAAIGDGDHGTTMGKVMDAAAAAAAGEGEGGDISSLLSVVGWAVLCVDGGSAPPLLAAFFAGMGEAAGEKPELDAAGLAASLAAGVRAMRAHSKAQVGDKTMMDALLPAVEAATAVATGGGDVSAVLRAAAAAAARGAAATADMTARFGRARNLGERARGHADPGATSIAVLLGAFSEAINQRQASHG